VLVAIGRRPVTAGLNLEKIGVEVDDKGRIVIDSEFNTSVKNIKCIGDVTFGPMLAHKAEEEGIAAVEYIHSGVGHVNYKAIPSVVYTHPEVAWVGKTEEDCKAEKIDYKVGTFPMVANSRAKTNNDTDGLVKVIIEASTEKILGVHIIASAAGDMLAEGVLAMEYGATAEDVARTCHAHPTVSEAVKEAAMDAYSQREPSLLTVLTHCTIAADRLHVALVSSDQLLRCLFRPYRLPVMLLPFYKITFNARVMAAGWCANRGRASPASSNRD